MHFCSFQAGSCIFTVTVQDFEQLSAEGIGARVLSDMMAGNFLDDNPLDFQSTKSPKRQFKHFRTTYLEFWDSIVKVCDDNGAFNMGRQSQENIEVGAVDNPTTLFDCITDMLAVFSSLRAR